MDEKGHRYRAGLALVEALLPMPYPVLSCPILPSLPCLLLYPVIPPFVILHCLAWSCPPLFFRAMPCSMPCSVPCSVRVLCTMLYAMLFAMLYAMVYAMLY